ncbi:uncharacterized protein [Lepeophtheirus salmonis]|uniref:uncharacterized protein n=1 Tax=Lepeophtheirus salmonis TaxID=72036 RepID=UPI001AE1C4CF|nr:neural Wiskott-Aldrich syndrome protein-like [Lepeophtheirus salmonis]
MILQTRLLTDAEVKDLGSLIPENCQGIAMTVVRLFFANPTKSDWDLQGTGAICLMKDYSRRSHYMQFLKADPKEVHWEQELYLELRLKFRSDRFYEFEGDSGSIGIQFADLSESEIFVSAVESVLTKKLERIKRRDNKRKIHDTAPELNNNTSKRGTKDVAASASSSNERDNESNFFSNINIFNRNRSRRSKKKRPEISEPSDFKHVTMHRDGKIVEDFGGLDDSVKHLLFMAGVNSNEILEDPKKQREIFQFLRKNNSDIEIINNHRETYSKGPRRVPPPPPTRSSNTAISNLDSKSIPPAPPLGKKPSLSPLKHPSIKPPPPPRTAPSTPAFKPDPPPPSNHFNHSVRHPKPKQSSSGRPNPPPPPPPPPPSVISIGSSAQSSLPPPPSVITAGSTAKSSQLPPPPPPPAKPPVRTSSNPSFPPPPPPSSAKSLHHVALARSHSKSSKNYSFPSPPTYTKSSNPSFPPPPPPSSNKLINYSAPPISSGKSSHSSVPPPPPPPSSSKSSLSSVPPPPILSSNSSAPPPPPSATTTTTTSPSNEQSHVKSKPSSSGPPPPPSGGSKPAFDICSAIKNASGTLQPVKPFEKKAVPEGRSALLDSIVNGGKKIQLKSVAERICKENVEATPETPTTLTEVLQIALLKIKNDVQVSSESEDGSNNDSDSSEWSDDESYQQKLEKFVSL